MSWRVLILSVATLAVTGTLLCPQVSAQESYIRGDCSSDGVMSICDGIRVLDHLFIGGGVLACEDACDYNDDGELDLADPIGMLTYLFGGGPTPADPFPSCGADPTDDALSCAVYEAGCADGPQVSRDAAGVWTITGGTLEEAFEAVGYESATDRLWQMELYRRVGRGRLAEIFGPDFLENDIFVRTLAYSDDEMATYLSELDDDTQAILEAYVAGINRRLGDVGADLSLLPFEFAALMIFPEPWTVEDVAHWWVVLLRQFSPEALRSDQVDNGALFQTLLAVHPTTAVGMFQDLRWLDDPTALTMHDGSSAGSTPASPAPPPSAIDIVAGLPDLDPVARGMRDRRERMRSRLESINAFVKMGSYAWSVSGTKTATGRPIIYSGPQMGWETPSIVMEGAIRGGGLDVSGMLVPGLPTIIIGRTPHHAWSSQVGHAHAVDYYLEDPSAVMFHRFETFAVAGAPEVTLPVYRSPRGPIVAPIPYDPSQPPTGPIVSWRYAHWGHEIKSLEVSLGLARATSVEEFAETMEQYAVSLHVCYADRDGNIAYWMTGKDPVRAAGDDPRLPSLADGTTDWPEPISYVPRSHSLNPAQGYFGGWNNKSHPGYVNCANPDFFGGEFSRAHVVEEFLNGASDLTFEELRDLAHSIATTSSLVRGGVSWTFFGEDFTAAVNAQPTPERLAALALLDGFNGYFLDGDPADWPTLDTRSDAWKLQEDWVNELVKLTFEDEFASIGMEYADQSQVALGNVLLRALHPEDSGFENLYDWFQDALGIGLPTDAEGLVVLALDNTLAALGPQPWNVPRGVIEYRHPMIPDPLWSTPFSNRSTYGQCVEMDVIGPVRVETLFPLGQSGFLGFDPETGSVIPDPAFFGLTPYYDNFVHRVLEVGCP